MGASVDAVTAVTVTDRTGHLIDLADKGHHISWIALLRCLASLDHQHLN